MDEKTNRKNFFPFPPFPFPPPPGLPDIFGSNDDNEERRESRFPSPPPLPAIPEPAMPPVTAAQLDRVRDDFKTATAPLSVLQSFVETVNSAFETVREGLKLWGPQGGEGSDTVMKKPSQKPPLV